MLVRGTAVAAASWLWVACLTPGNGTSDPDAAVSAPDANLALIACDSAAQCGGGSAVCECGFCADTDLECTASTLRYMTIAGEGECVPAPTQLSLGYQHGCMRWSDGRVSCWGLNCNGQVGNQPNDLDCDPDPQVRLTPTTVTESAGGDPLSGVEQVEVGFLHSCARHQDGTVSCWGSGSQGQLGNGATVDSLAPVRVRREESDLTGASTLSAGGFHTCALSGDAAVCWGSNQYGQLGVAGWTGSDDVRSSAEPVLSGEAFTGVTAGGEHSCGTHGTGMDRRAMCWGRSNLGQLGRNLPGNEATVPTPTTVYLEGDSTQLTRVLEMGLGNYFSCAATGFPDQLWCWGEDRNYALGTSDPDDAAAATAWGARLSLLDPGDFNGTRQIDGGDDFACARMHNGELYCWGGNASGQLGRDTGGSPDAPALTMSNVIDFAAGFSFACAITSDRQVLCWGDNAAGQLGDGTQTSRFEPEPMQGVCP